MVFFIGGPNVRKDYHIDLSEEVFYQLKGNMCLKVLEQGEFKDVDIREGEIFMLPSRIPHSPQRHKNTIGLVIERKRLPNEKDGLRYFVQDGSQTILYERWAHIQDIRADLPPIIKGFFNSEACRHGKPTSESVIEPQPFELDSKTKLLEPFNLKNWIQRNIEEIRSKGCKVIFGPPEFTTTVMIYAGGEHQFHSGNRNISIHQISGESILTTCADKYRKLEKDDIAMEGTNTNVTIKTVTDDSLFLTVQMEPPSE